MRFALLICSFGLLLSGCLARAPEVRRAGCTDDGTSAPGACVEKPTRHPERRVYYALPRTLLNVDLALVRKTLVPARWAPAPGQDERCKNALPKHALDPSNYCYWGFKTDVALPADPALACEVGKVNLYVKEGGVTVSTTAVPDPSNIYWIDLDPGLFTKLNAKLELSSDGAPMNFSFTSTAMGMEIFDRAVKLMPGMLLKSSIGPIIDESVGSSAGTAGFDEVLAMLGAMERERLALLKNGKLTAEANELILAEQAKLRKRVEPSIKEEPVTVSMQWDPDEAQFEKGISRVARKEIPAGVLCKDEAAAHLHLFASDYSRAYREAQPKAGTDDDGFRYRVPLVATAKIRLSLPAPANPAEPANAPPCSPAEPNDGCVSLKDGFAVAQIGTVRSLPRRIGFGSGSLGGSLDAQTGALKSINNEAAGAGGPVLTRVIEQTSKDHDAAALQAEVAELELRVKRCKARRDLGLQPGADCPAT